MLGPPKTVNTSPYVPPIDPIAPLRAALRGHYDIEREIGQGAFATVYLARDLKHERKVAVKVLNADPTSDIGELRFIREIRTLARLQHPNILPLHDSGHVEAMLYYVMPYVSGDTVRDRIDREKQMSVESACSIARDVADALAYAHAQGIIHRDIKPDNILLSTGHPILADFGIARAIDLAGVRQLTRTGAASPGTPAYMSPEQLMGDKELDGRSDTYSLGCVLFEMLTGKPPFAGKEGFVKRFTEPPPKASTLRKDLPAWVDDAVEKALQREPRDRYPTAKEFLNALQPPPLEEISAGHPIVHPRNSGGVISRMPDTGNPAPAQTRRNWRASIAAHPRLAWSALATLAFAIIIGVVVTKGVALPDILGRDTIGNPAKIVILPLRGDRARGEAFARSLRDSFSKWQGLYVVSDLELADALSGRTPVSLGEARAVARSLGAGKLIWGRLGGGADSLRASIELYDLASDRSVPPREVNIAGLAADDQTYADALTALMKDPKRPAAADGGDRGTTSYVAWRAYGDGHIALAGWNLSLALQEFTKAMAADPNYAAARLWVAQVAAWERPGVGVDWRIEARRALAGRSLLSVRDSLLSEGLAAMAEKRFPRACASYHRLTYIDSSDFAGWYGLGECQSLDDAVIPDRHSPSGKSFRSSYHAAVIAYQRSFRAAPETRSWLSSDRLESLLPATPTIIRAGQDASGAYFMAYPSLVADTIAFVPYPELTFAALPPDAVANLGVALDRNAEIRRDIALEWVRASPQSSDAQEALADVLEGRGDLAAPGKSALSSMSALRRAQELATNDEQKLRLLGREVRLLFKLGNFAAARTRADSVLARYDGGSVTDARELAPLAAMTGKMTRLAQLVRTSGLQTANVNIPAPLQELGANFFARAALGVCDGLRDSRLLLEQRLNSYVSEENRSEVRAALEWRPLSLSAPCSKGESALGITTPADRLYQMQQSFARGDFKSVRETFSALARTRRGMRAGDISLDYTYQEAWLLAAIGDTVQAINTLSLALNALPTLSAAALKEPAAAAATGRALMLAADLAAATGDRRTATKWAAAVVDLWKNADPPLQSSVRRMRELANNSRAQ